MKLATEKPWVISNLDNLDEVFFRINSGKDQTAFFQRFAVGVIELETMTMALTDIFLAINSACQSLLLQGAGISPKPHCAAFTLDLLLTFHNVNDRVLGVFLEFTGISFLDFTDRTRKLDHGHLHTKADAKEGDLVFPGMSNRSNLPLAATLAETTRDQDTVDIIKRRANP